MTPIKNYPNPPPPGLTEAIESVGLLLVNADGVWTANDAVAAEAIAASYDAKPYVVAQQKTALANHRWGVETGGVMFGTHPVHTTREAQGTLTAALLAVSAGAYPANTQWKAANGEFFALPANQVASLYATVAGHVQACFAREAALVAQIEAATTWEEAAAIDITTGFPSNA